MIAKVIVNGSLDSVASWQSDSAIHITQIESLTIHDFEKQLSGTASDDLIVFVNGDRCFSKGKLDQLENTFLNQHCDVLFSASAGFHYDDEVLRYYFWKFYPRFHTPFHYLDSNAFVGKAGALKKLFSQISKEYQDGISWHDLLTRFYVECLLKALYTDLIINLDRDQNIFCNLDGRRSAFRWPMLGWMHADLFLRMETADLQQKDLTYLQDRSWDLSWDKEGLPYIIGYKNPVLYIANGGAKNLSRIKDRIEGVEPKGKEFGMYMTSLAAYIKSIFAFFYALLINRGSTSPYRIFRYSANKNAEWKAVMEKFLNHLERKEGFTFAHFNDGELTFIKKYINGDHAETWFGRRQQKYTKQLGERLTKALKLDQKGYYVGVPCSTHHPRLRKLADELTEGQTNTVPAMSLHHNPRYFPNLINHMKDRQCFFVKNEYQKLDVFEKLGVDIKPDNQIIVPFKNSYLLFDELKERKFPDGAIVILICGMLAKIIIPEWFERNPNTTFIALGSSMDDFIQRTNTSFRLYPKEGLPLTCNIQPTKFFAFGWKKECKECWTMEKEFTLD